MPKAVPKSSLAVTLATRSFTSYPAPSATFDFKDNPAVPKDFIVNKIPPGIYFPVNFLPGIAKIMDRVAMVRSFVTHEEVHLRGQYYVQAGRQLNVAFSREIPSIGPVVAYELESRRRLSGTFPTYVSFNLDTNQAGALSTGFLPPQYSVFDLNAAQALTGMILDQKASERIEERRRVGQLNGNYRGPLHDAKGIGGAGWAQFRASCRFDLDCQ